MCSFTGFQRQNKKILLRYKENTGVLNIQIIGNEVVKRSVASCFIISPNLNCLMNWMQHNENAILILS